MLIFDSSGLPSTILTLSARTTGGLIDSRACMLAGGEDYALVAAITGRPGALGREMVGVDGMEVVGSHGLELAAGADEWRARLQEFRATVDWPVEDKGLGLSYHYRTHEDPDRARAGPDHGEGQGRGDRVHTAGPAGALWATSLRWA